MKARDTIYLAKNIGRGRKNKVLLVFGFTISILSCSISIWLSYIFQTQYRRLVASDSAALCAKIEYSDRGYVSSQAGINDGSYRFLADDDLAETLSQGQESFRFMDLALSSCLGPFAACDVTVSSREYAVTRYAPVIRIYDQSSSRIHVTVKEGDLATQRGELMISERFVRNFLENRTGLVNSSIDLLYRLNGLPTDVSPAVAEYNFSDGAIRSAQIYAEIPLFRDFTITGITTDEDYDFLIGTLSYDSDSFPQADYELWEQKNKIVYDYGCTDVIELARTRAAKRLFFPFLYGVETRSEWISVGGAPDETWNLWIFCNEFSQVTATINAVKVVLRRSGYAVGTQKEILGTIPTAAFRRLETAESFVGTLNWILTIVAVVLGVLSALNLFYTMEFMLHSNADAYGMFLTIGMKRSELQSVVLTETLLLFAYACVMSLVVGLGVLSIIIVVSQIPFATGALGFSLNWKTLWLFLPSALIVSLVATVLGGLICHAITRGFENE